MSNFKTRMFQVRANFLVLSVFLVLLGVSLAFRFSGGEEISLVKILLVMAGVISAHISVNLFNEYSDFKSGIDFQTNRTVWLLKCSENQATNKQV